MPGTIQALPDVAKKSLLAPNTEEQPLPYLAFVFLLSYMETTWYEPYYIEMC